MRVPLMSEYTDRFGSARVFNPEPEPAPGVQSRMGINWLPAHFRNLSAGSSYTQDTPRDKGNRPHIYRTTDASLGYAGTGMRVRSEADDDCPGCGLCELEQGTSRAGLPGMAPDDSLVRRAERTAAGAAIGQAQNADRQAEFQARKARHPESYADQRVWRNGRGRNVGRVAERQDSDHGDAGQHTMTPGALLGGRFDGRTRSGGTK
jgi:hypothetical protein